MEVESYSLENSLKNPPNSNQTMANKFTINEIIRPDRYPWICSNIVKISATANNDIALLFIYFFSFSLFLLPQILPTGLWEWPHRDRLVFALDIMFTGFLKRSILWYCISPDKMYRQYWLPMIKCIKHGVSDFKAWFCLLLTHLTSLIIPNIKCICL